MKRNKAIRAKVAGLVTGLIFLQLLPSPALAWGAEGHGAVARIAARLLTQRARTRVQEILSPHGETLVGVALWADDIRGEEAGKRPETPNWHFVDTPLGSNYDAGRDCVEATNGSCVINALVMFQDILAEKKKGYHSRKFNRYEALKFIVHYAGDLHQPLHCITDKRNDPDGDNGGGKKNVVWFGTSGRNLHSVWDTFILRRNMENGNNASVQTFSTLLFNSLTAQERLFAKPSNSTTPTVVSRSTIESWAIDSHAIAEGAYRDLGQPDASGRYRLGQNYFDAHSDEVDQQIKLAGVRLARILNENLR